MSESKKSIKQQAVEKVEARLAQERVNPTGDVQEAASSLAYIPEGSAENQPDAPPPEADAIVPPSDVPAASPDAENAGESSRTEAPDTKPDGASAPREKPTGKNEPAKATPPADVPVEEWEDAEYEDTSTGYKYAFKAKKGEAEFLRAGQLRRSDYDKKLGILGRHRDYLEPMIESGYLDQVMPVFRAIDQDEALARAVGELYQKRLRNEPLTYVQPGMEHMLQGQQNPQAQQQTQVQEDDEYADPYMRAEFSKVSKPLMDEFAQLKAQLTQQQQAQIQQQQMQLQQQQMQQAENMKWSRIHQELVREFPGEFTGNTQNQEEMQRLVQLRNFADQSGYSEQHYGDIGRILHAKRVLAQSAPQRHTPAQSQAAQSVAQAQAQAEELARRASASVANGVVVGAQAAPPPGPPRPKSTRDKDGNPLPIRKAISRVLENAQHAQR